MENGNNLNEAESFLIEAAINEEGPRKLQVVPSSDKEFVIYDDGKFLCKIEKKKGEEDVGDDGEEWEVLEGDITKGIARVIGKEISRVV
jgi:hypothetical protein